MIGCGAVTERKSGPAFYGARGSMVSAVCCRTLAKAQDYARRHGIDIALDDAAALVAHPQVDAVYIATPPDSHCQLALQVAAAGKPCCVEKPMALNAAECERMVAAFEQAGQALFVSYYRRSLPRFEQVRRWLHSGALGLVRQVHWQFCKAASTLDLAGDYNWRTDARIAAGGYFDDLASHGIDLLQYLLGDIARVAGLSANQQQLYPAADAVAAIWQHCDSALGQGIVGSGNWNFGADDRRDRVEITGERGHIHFAVFDDEPVVLQNESGRVALAIANPVPIQQPHVHTMLAHLRGQCLHPSSGLSASKTARVIDGILRARPATL
jgi:1,5-anhydro-D-fructose reductase (1,5-anhydro-D-mannitol-forming)